MQTVQVAIPIEQIHSLCSRHHILRLALFGSVLREDFGADSDLDVLVEFEEGHTPGFSFFQIQEELSALFGRSVDLNTPNFLSPYFRNDVSQDALIIYEQPGLHTSEAHA